MRESSFWDRIPEANLETIDGRDIAWPSAVSESRRQLREPVPGALRPICYVRPSMAGRLLRELAPSVLIEIVRAQRLLVRSGLNDRKAWMRALMASRRVDAAHLAF